MGQNTSQLDPGDYEAFESQHFRSQSPTEQSPGGTENPDTSDRGSPQPFAHNIPSSQDFAFSSQVPHSATRSQPISKANRRRPKTKSTFETMSASPEPTMEPEHDMHDTEQDQQVPAPQPAKKKRDRKKKQSLTMASHELGVMPAASESAPEVRAFEPRSSIDFDAASSPLVGEAMPTIGQGHEDGDTVDATLTQLDPDQLQRQEKKDRKERKRAKKAAKHAEQLRSSLLATSPGFDNHDVSNHLEQPREVYLQSEDIEDERVPAGDQEDGNSLMDDPNQLPTPDDEVHHDAHPLNPTFSHDSTTDPALAEESAAQPSQRKRKARDSDKKSRKRRREQSHLSHETSAGNDAINSNSVVGTAGDGTDDWPLPTKQSSPASATGDSRIGEIAREYYSQRYASKDYTPSESNTAAASNKRLNVSGVSPGYADDSPSLARLQRQRPSRSSSPRHLVKHERLEEEEEEEGPAESMDIDANEEQPSTEPHATIVSGADEEPDSVVDESMADDDDNDGDAPSTASGLEKQAHFTSDDLGVDGTVEDDGGQGISEIGESPGPDQQQAFDSPVQPGTTIKPSKSLRQYGSKASTSKKRKAKSSYLERAEQDNVQAFAELPSPAVAAASRKGKAHAKRTTVPTVAGPSSASQRSEKQPKLVSMMGDGSAKKSTATHHPSNAPTPTPTFTHTLPKAATRIKNPSPEDEVTGRFSRDEMRDLNAAIEQWRKNHGLTDQEVIDMVQKNPQRAKSSDFWDYVHYACPKRKRQKIINQVRKTHHNFVARAAWTVEQHQELAAYYEQHGKKYKLLGELINRHPDDVRDRIRNYIVCGDARKKAAWTEDEVAEFVAIVDNALDKIRELRKDDPPNLDRPDDEELVDWSLVSENMGFTRSRLQCRAKWKQIRFKLEGGNIDGKAGHSMEEIIQEARNDFTKMESYDLYLIAKAIKRSGTMADSRIGWHKLRESWYAMEKWNRPALMLAWYRLRHSIPDWKIMSVPEVAKYWMDIYAETKEINVLPEDQLDLDAEYREIKHKVAKIIGDDDARKARHLSIEIDEDESDHEASVDLGEAMEQDELEAVQSEPEGGLEAEDEVPKPQSQSRSKAKAARSSRKAQPTIEQSPVVQPEDFTHDASDSSFISKKRKKAKRAVAQPRSQSAKSTKSKFAKRSLSAGKVVEDVSSDTDADDVEDIPAVLPE
ncbi:hypothetical protein TruAng_005956 [Truncatella angustata]|nr:hypothetical protein TruAng_005956 [Truncatella angustata]